MRISRSLATGLLGLALFTLLASACSSSPKATPEFSKGLTYIYTPSQGQAPVLPATYTNCIYGKATPADRTSVGKITSQADSDNEPDAVSVRITRASNACDATLTQQLIETAIFTGAPSSISASQKSCATTKAIAALDALDDSKLSGSNSQTVKDTLNKAVSSCGISLGG